MNKPNINEIIKHFISEVLFVMGVKVQELSLEKAIVLHRHDEELVELKDIGDLSSGTRLHLDAKVEHKGLTKTLTAKVVIRSDGKIEVQNFNIETTEIVPEDVKGRELTEIALETLKKHEDELFTLFSRALEVVIDFLTRKGS